MDQNYDLNKYLIEILDIVKTNKYVPDSVYHAQSSRMQGVNVNKLKNMTKHYVEMIYLMRKMNVIISGLSKNSGKNEVTLKTLKHIYNKNKNIINELEDKLNTSNRSIYLKKNEVRDVGRTNLILKYFLFIFVGFVVLIGVLSKL